jgi:hypothetical protein
VASLHKPLIKVNMQDTLGDVTSLILPRLTMLGYEYVDLTEDQKVARRRHLNWAGYSVIISQLLVFSISYVYLRLKRSSAHPRTARVKKLAQLEWWLSLPISLDHPELRCLGDWLVVLAWWGWCVGLAIVNTGNGAYQLSVAYLHT